jgi:hypothetical protein
MYWRWRCAWPSGGLSEDEPFRMKKGGSLSAYDVLASLIWLLDWLNHVSALLLSPELPLPLSGRRLEGEPSLLLLLVLVPLLSFPVCMEVLLAEGAAAAADLRFWIVGLGAAFEGEWRRETDRWAGGLRALNCDG